MKRPGLVEDIIARTSTQGWDFFTGVPEEIRKRIEPIEAKAEEDRKMIAGAWADFAATEPGRVALQALFDSTINRTVFFVNLGQDAQAMAMWGCFREGQNALAHEIARQVALGREAEDQPKPRDVP